MTTPHRLRLYRTVEGQRPNARLFWAASCKNCSFRVVKKTEESRDRLAQFHLRMTARSMTLEDFLAIGHQLINRLGSIDALDALIARREGYGIDAVSDTLIDMMPEFSPEALAAARAACVEDGEFTPEALKALVLSIPMSVL